MSDKWTNRKISRKKVRQMDREKDFKKESLIERKKDSSFACRL